MRLLRLLPLTALLFGLACGDEDVAPCEIQQLVVSLTGMVDDLESAPVPLALTAEYSPSSIDPIAFEYLAQVLGHNAPTGSGSSAVFNITGTPNAPGMIIQLAGSRIDGSVLDILGVMPVALFPGEHPSFSAIPRNALLLLFGDDDYGATTAEGQLTVTQVAPLEGPCTPSCATGQGGRAWSTATWW